MQAVTTELITTQVQDAQLPKETKLSSNNPSVSFQEMMDSIKDAELIAKDNVSSYADDSKIEAQKSDEEVNKTDELKNESKSEKAKDKEENKQVESKEESEPKEVKDEEDSKAKDIKSEEKNPHVAKKTLEFEEVSILSFTGNAGAAVENAKNTENVLQSKGLEKANTEGKKKSVSGVVQSKLDKAGKITVTDLRTQKVNETGNTKKAESKLNFDVKMNNNNTATVTMEFASQNAKNNIMSLNTQAAASDGSNFQAMLNNQIQEHVPEFVKTGSLILKDNDQGTINLILHPEDLGNVKIHLSLDGKTVSGHIIVATKEALDVFKNNAETLREAFKANGFDNASFNVSYNDNGSGYGQNSGGEFNSNDFAARQAYAFEGEVSGVDEPVLVKNMSEKNSEHSINIVA